MLDTTTRCGVEATRDPPHGGSPFPVERLPCVRGPSVEIGVCQRTSHRCLAPGKIADVSAEGLQ